MFTTILARKALVVTVGLVAAALAGCTSSAGGGALQGVPCALDGSCPSGMSCGGQFCVYDATDAQDASVGASDAGGDSGDGTADGGGGGQDAGAGDVAVDSVGVDSGGVDSVGIDSGGVDGGKADTAGDIGSDGAGADGGGSAGLSIAGLQQGTASQICSNAGGQATTVADVTLEVGVATAPISALGKLWVFYLRPKTPSDPSGKAQGIKVVIFGDNPPQIQAGDLVKVRGDVVEYFCETEVTTKPELVEIVGKAALEPVPFDVSCADVAAASGASEPFEGGYVRISNVSITAANVFGTDSKTHGTFAVAPAGSKGPEVHVAPTAGTTFSKKDDKTGEVVTIYGGTESFKAIRGHLTYSFGTYQLRPTSDADLVQ